MVCVAAHWKHGRQSKAFVEARKKIWAELRRVEGEMRIMGFVSWYRLAAEQGNVNGQFNLGRMYVRGQGVVRDHIMAHMWYNISTANGNGDGYVRDRLAERMTTADITEAQRRARVCMESNYQDCD